MLQRGLEMRHDVIALHPPIHLGRHLKIQSPSGHKGECRVGTHRTGLRESEVLPPWQNVDPWFDERFALDGNVGPAPSEKSPGADARIYIQMPEAKRRRRLRRNGHSQTGAGDPIEDVNAEI